jgi:hypothetical protein
MLHARGKNVPGAVIVVIHTFMQSYIHALIHTFIRAFIHTYRYAIYVEVYVAY